MVWVGVDGFLLRFEDALILVEDPGYALAQLVGAALLAQLVVAANAQK